MTTLSVAGFRRSGYLMAVNRLLLHPLGLALSVAIGDDGTESFGTIWDARGDLKGIVYEDAAFGDAEIANAQRIDQELAARLYFRQLYRGWGIQPLDAVDEFPQGEMDVQPVVWLALRIPSDYDEDPVVRVVGIYSTEKGAVEHAKDPFTVIGPLAIDEEYGNGDWKWVGAYYPAAAQRQEAA